MADTAWSHTNQTTLCKIIGTWYKVDQENIYWIETSRKMHAAYKDNAHYLYHAKYDRINSIITSS